MRKLPREKPSERYARHERRDDAGR
eukprot:SAG31_NODE_29118_length_400_cov_1.166113_1_plen_24_part_01